MTVKYYSLRKRVTVGGVDYGETPGQALLRELSEELSVSTQDMRCDETILYAVFGATVRGIPNASLFYRVDVSANKVQATNQVLSSAWFNLSELPDLFLSSSVGEVGKLVAVLEKMVV